MIGRYPPYALKRAGIWLLILAGFVPLFFDSSPKSILAFTAYSILLMFLRTKLGKKDKESYDSYIEIEKAFFEVQNSIDRPDMSDSVNLAWTRFCNKMKRHLEEWPKDNRGNMAEFRNLYESQCEGG